MLQLGWGKFLEFDYEVNSRLVVWFFRYVKFSWVVDDFDDRHPHCEIDCGSQVVRYSCDDLESDFGLKCSGHDDLGWESWPEGDSVWSYNRVVNDLNERDVVVANPGQFCNASKLSGNNRMLFRFIRDILIPTSSQDQRLSQPEMLFMYLFNHDKPINLPHIIFSHLQRALETKQASTYPYGALVTFIMRKWKIVIGEKVEGTRPATLNNASLLGTLNLSPDGDFVWENEERRGRRSNVEGCEGRRSNVEGSLARRSSVEASSSRPRRSNVEASLARELALTRKDNKAIKKKLNAFEKFFRLIGAKLGCTSAELDVLNVPTRRRHGKDPIPPPVVQEEEEDESDDEHEDDDDEDEEDEGEEQVESDDDDESS